MTEYKSKVKYEAPIEINIEEDFPDSGSMAVSEIENMICSAVLKVGITVDKEELIKALRYDRGQYEKGYADGKRDAADAIEELQAEVQFYDALAEEWQSAAENKERLLGLYRAEQAKRFYSATDNNGRIIQNPCDCMNIPVFSDCSESPNS